MRDRHLAKVGLAHVAACRVRLQLEQAADLVGGQIVGAWRLACPFADGPPLGSAVYFMMSPAAPVKLHRIKNHQLYHHYLGDPIEVLMLHDDGTHTFAVVGADLRAGQRVQLFIPGNTLHIARIIGERRWSSAPAPNGQAWFRPRDVDLGDAEALSAKYPDCHR
jgi:uncharacterized protein